MLFNSLVFLIFFAIFFAIWPLARRKPGLRWGWLTFCSFIFYGWWDWRFCFLILGSGLLDFFAALGMQRYPRHRRLLLVLSVIGNIGSLAVFKYLDFGIASLNAALSSLGFETSFDLLSLTLPVGISFYTFQSMSYTIDVYRGELEPTRRPLHFFAYLSMFPQLVAGPIVRARDLLPQLANDKPPSETDLWGGLRLVVLGYFKKMVIADNVAFGVNTAFKAAEPMPSGAFWWLVATLFAFQIYCDFSGYTDIARGLGRMMGYRYPENFRHPYRARSLQEFWSRWHISLSTWFRDYVYIPLGGNRVGEARAHLNMWITMLLSGLWHGAAWTFVGWGALHAALLSVERATKWPERLKALPAGGLVAQGLIIMQVWAAWVMFRAESFGQAAQVLGLMFNPLQFNAAGIAIISSTALLFLGVGILMELGLIFGAPLAARWESRTWWRSGMEPALVALGIAACVFLRGKGGAFIYFQF